MWCLRLFWNFKKLQIKFPWQRNYSKQWREANDNRRHLFLAETGGVSSWILSFQNVMLKSTEIVSNCKSKSLIQTLEQLRVSLAINSKPIKMC